jgi:hypothetical protein
LASLLVLAGLGAGSARAELLYAVTFGDQLIRVDTATGAGALVGPLSSPMAAFGLGFRGPNLYTFDQTADLLRQLNPPTGATVASINIGVGNLAGEGAVDFRGDGIGFLSQSSGGTGQLFRFDITVPGSTPITGPGGLIPSMDGLAFAPDGTLYGIRQGGGALYTINPTTGATTLVGLTGLGDPFILGGLTFAGDGNLYAALSNQGGPSFLYRVNQTTGAATLIGNIGFTGVSGLTSGNVADVAIPEPVSLAVFGLGLVGLVGVRRARRAAVA